MSIMLYKYPGKHEIHGDLFDYKIVGSEQKEAALSDGWHMSTTEAKAASEVDDSAVTREEMEVKAKELGIPFNSRTLDEVLLERIADALE